MIFIYFYYVINKKLKNNIIVVPIKNNKMC